MRSSNARNASKKHCRLMQSAVRASLNARRFLGHPSVGGRLTASAAGRSSQGTAVLCSRASVPVGCTVPLGKSLWSVSAHGHMRVAELARPRAAKQTRAMECPSFLMECPSFLVAVELQQFAPVVSGAAAFKACLPAPNHSIERTCLKPLRAFSPTAHVER